jgi:hypothetical protein
MRSMSLPRLAVVAVLLSSCAAWDTTNQHTPPPPAEGPTPSHVAPNVAYTPPPPVGPTAPLPEPPHVEIKVAIASVQLIEDCPDPAPAAAQEMSAKQSVARGDVADGGSRFDRSCTQSTVQLALRSDVQGPFRVEAVRVLDAKTQRPVGTTSLRGPTRWRAEDGMYMPWDERVDVKSELKISYKLGAFDRVGGPYVLELEVSVDGHRQTIRSPEFIDEPPHMMVT